MTIKFLTRLFPFLSRPARTKRFEILLRLNYNDGTLIEAEKFDKTAEELCERFGGVTQDTVRILGGTAAPATATTFSACASTPKTQPPALFSKPKRESGKNASSRSNIWITAHEIEVI
jgi:hypothetical protein